MSHHEHNHSHSHVDEKGQLVKCYHECKSQVTSLSFWVMMTIFFPIEHILWDNVPPFSTINHFAATAFHNDAPPVGAHASLTIEPKHVHSCEEYADEDECPSKK